MDNYKDVPVIELIKLAMNNINQDGLHYDFDISNNGLKITTVDNFDNQAPAFDMLNLSDTTKSVEDIILANNVLSHEYLEHEETAYATDELVNYIHLSALSNYLKADYSSVIERCDEIYDDFWVTGYDLMDEEDDYSIPQLASEYIESFFFGKISDDGIINASSHKIDKEVFEYIFNETNIVTGVKSIDDNGVLRLGSYNIQLVSVHNSNEVIFEREYQNDFAFDFHDNQLNLANQFATDLYNHISKNVLSLKESGNKNKLK